MKQNLPNFNFKARWKWRKFQAISYSEILCLKNLAMISWKSVTWIEGKKMIHYINVHIVFPVSLVSTHPDELTRGKQSEVGLSNFFYFNF